MKKLTYITARGNKATLEELEPEFGISRYREVEKGQPTIEFDAKEGFVKAKHDLLLFYNEDKIISTE